MRLPITPLCADYLRIWFVERYECGDDDEPTIAAAITVSQRAVEVPDALVLRFAELLLEAINTDSDAGESVRMLDRATELWQEVRRRS